MALSDYLASKYLSADQKPSKKRKRKDAAKADGLTIAEDESNDWSKPKGDDEDDGDAPTMVGNALAGGLNKPKKKSTWIKVGASAPKDSEQAAADAILADAQADADKRTAQDEDAPAVVESGEPEGPTMASGAMAGLQTADQVTAALKRKEKAEKKRMREDGLDPTGKAQDTIYRDASGRIINVSMKRAELRRREEEEERKKQEELESRKGDVQRREKEQRKQDLEDARVMTVARGADDKRLNEELKERERWNDPMAQLLASKKSSKGGKSKLNERSYQCAFDPNRYGIRPGFRWDGVDRGNGFEKKWFQARNKAKDRAELEYMWQMDE